MNALLVLVLLGGMPETVAVADAVVSARIASRPALPNTLKKEERAGQPAVAPVVDVQIQPALIQARTEGPEVAVTMYFTPQCEPCGRAFGEMKRGKGSRKIAWVARDFDLPRYAEVVPFYEWKVNGRSWSLAGFHTREQIEAAIRETEQVKP